MYLKLAVIYELCVLSSKYIAEKYLVEVIKYFLLNVL